MSKLNKKNITVICAVVAAVFVFAAPTAAFGSLYEESAVRNENDSVGCVAQMTETPAITSQEVKTIADTEDPIVKPRVYKARAKTNGRGVVTLFWPKVEDARGYTIYRSSKSDKLGKKIATVKRTARRYVDETADVMKKYYYTIKAWKRVDGKRVAVTTMTKRVNNKLNTKDSFTVKAYAYSGGGTTASGKKAQEGRIAVDPNVIELGTWLYVEDYGICQAADTGGNIKGKTIDLYMDTEAECNEWGVRHKTIYILE